MEAATLLNFPGLPERGWEFHRKLIDLSRRIEADPDAISAVMYSESGYNPQAVNPRGGASGLIQIMPEFAPLFGHTIEEIRAMDAIQQLDLVEKRFGWEKGRLHRPVDYFLSNFFPVAVGKPDSFIMGQEGNNNPVTAGGKLTYHQVYVGNTPKGRRGPLDYNLDGIIDVADMKAHVAKVYSRAEGRSLIVVGDEPGPVPVPPPIEPPITEPGSTPPKSSEASKGFAWAIGAAIGYFIMRLFGKRK